MSVEKKGLVYVFIGDGKGKTSAALGIAVRAVCNGMRVGWVSFFKEESWSISEKNLPSRLDLESKLEMYFMGEGFYKLPTDRVKPEKHKKAAREALGKSESLLKKVDVLVMDEVVKAVADGLVEEKRLMKMLEKRGEAHMILTGRGPTDPGFEDSIGMILEGADLVTECKKIKHPFDRGIGAVKGLDF